MDILVIKKKPFFYVFMYGIEFKQRITQKFPMSSNCVRKLKICFKKIMESKKT